MLSPVLCTKDAEREKTPKLYPHEAQKKFFLMINIFIALGAGANAQELLVGQARFLFSITGEAKILTAGEDNI